MRSGTFLRVSSLYCNLSIVSLGQNIKRVRWEAGLRTQKALADLLGVPQPQVSDWENDRYAVLETLTLVKIAKGLRCSVDRLLAGVDPDYDRVREADRSTRVEPARVDPSAETPAEIPVIAEGETFRGEARDRKREPNGIVQWTSRPGDLRDPDAYGVRIRGDSMVPAHRPTMIAIVSPGRSVQDGDEAYVQLASGECLVRLTRTVAGGFMLQPYNHEYRARFVKPKDVQAMHVILYSRRRDP